MEPNKSLPCRTLPCIMEGLKGSTVYSWNAPGHFFIQAHFLDSSGKKWSNTLCGWKTEQQLVHSWTAKSFMDLWTYSFSHLLKVSITLFCLLFTWTISRMTIYFRNCSPLSHSHQIQFLFPYLAKECWHAWQTMVDIICTHTVCISYPLAYFKYFKKYALTANVSANVLTYFTYVETFVVNAYVFKYFENTKG